MNSKIIQLVLQSIGKRPTLAEKYDYVMFGKVFKYKDAADSGQVKADVRLSFLHFFFLMLLEEKRFLVKSSQFNLIWPTEGYFYIGE